MGADEFALFKILAAVAVRLIQSTSYTTHLWLSSVQVMITPEYMKRQPGLRYGHTISVMTTLLNQPVFHLTASTLQLVVKVPSVRYGVRLIGLKSLILPKRVLMFLCLVMIQIRIPLANLSSGMSTVHTY